MAIHVLEPSNLLTGGDMSGTITSNTLTLTYGRFVGFQFNFTGTPNGTFFVQGSIDRGRNFVNLDLSPVPVASGGDNNIYIDITATSHQLLRAVYVPTSGTGSLDIWVTYKGGV